MAHSRAGNADSAWNHELAHDVRRELFGGVGVVRVWSLSDAPIAPFTAVLACELEPAASVGPHVQDHFSELVVAVSGRGHARVGGARAELAPGAVVQLELGQALSIVNESSQEPLRYLIIKARA